MKAGLPFGKCSLAAALSLGAAGCGAAASSTNTNAKQGISHQRDAYLPSTLVVSNQSTSGYSVRITSLTASDSSAPEGKSSSHGGDYVALASDVSGKPGVVLGYTALREGASKNVVVKVSAKLTSGRYFVWLDPPGSKPMSVTAFVLSKKLTRSVT